MPKTQSRTVTISYGLLNNPNKRGIEKAINKWTDKGYALTHRQDKEVGCLALLFTFGWARGRTELTFVKTE